MVGFALLCPAVSTGATIQLPGTTDCLAGEPTEPVHISHVTDGDTLVLTDKRRVRIIGLNALEMNARSRKNRQWAAIAKNTLEKWVREAESIELIAGVENIDRYGRTLAHLRSSDGSSAAQSLIEQGLAMAVTVGVNNRCAAQMHASEQKARDAELGIWRNPGSWRLDKRRLNGRERGFRLITSRVELIKTYKDVTYLELENGVQIHFDEHWRSLPPTVMMTGRNLIGKLLEVRGWLRSYKGRQQLTVSHPADIKILSR